MKSKSLSIYFGSLAGLVLVLGGCVHRGEQNYPASLSTVTGGSADALIVDAKEPAMVVHIDPATGKVIPPSGGSLPDSMSRSSSEAARVPPQKRLVETPNLGPGGGVVIQLDERFQTPLTATIDSDGKVRFKHDPSASGIDTKE